MMDVSDRTHARIYYLPRIREVKYCKQFASWASKVQYLITLMYQARLLCLERCATT